jgi:hypothetical protein
MRKVLNDKSKKFEEFLGLVKAIKRKGITLWDGQGNIIPTNPILSDIRDIYSPKLKEIENNYSAEDETEILRYALKRVTIGHFDDPTPFFQFLFQKDSPDEIKIDGLFEDIYDVSAGLWAAIDAYYFFYENYRALDDVMTRIQRMRENGTLPKGKQKKRIGLRQMSVQYILDSSQIIEMSVIEENLFYGFRDFSSVLSCRFCQNYFLAKRADAKYCSTTCGSAHRQKEWLKNETNRQEQLKAKREYYHKNKEKQKANYIEKLIRESKQK